MNMLDLMNKMTQLSEAKEKTKTGLKHTAEPGGYGRKDDEDDEGNKVKATAVKKGKGRPKKDADDSGETKKYDFSAFGVKSGKDVKLPKHDKKKTTVVKGKSQSHAANKADDGTDPGEPAKKKKGLKEYFDALETVVVEAEQETQQETQSRVSEQTQSVTETTEKEVIEVSTSSLEIILPNAFTPNGDGVNETLQLNISEDKLTPGTFSFVVIDRLGKTVYQTTDIHFEWEGVSMNGEVVLAGDYVYYVTARDIKGKLITKYSTLHIVR